MFTPSSQNFRRVSQYFSILQQHLFSGDNDNINTFSDIEVLPVHGDFKPANDNSR